jgi:hypothetical protein
MDPYLQRQICPNFYRPNFGGSNFRLTGTPAHNFVTPGIGQITNLYSFYTPLHSQRPLHAIQKEVSTSLNQEGSGKIEEKR